MVIFHNKMWFLIYRFWYVKAYYFSAYIKSILYYIFPGWLNINFFIYWTLFWPSKHMHVKSKILYYPQIDDYRIPILFKTHNIWWIIKINKNILLSPDQYMRSFNIITVYMRKKEGVFVIKNQNELGIKETEDNRNF